jgi:flagellar protein FlbD
VTPAGFGGSMIELTRLNKSRLVVNSDLIKFIENTPDTVLTLTTGEKVVVSESCHAVIEKVVEFRRRTTAGLSCPLGGSGRESEQRNTPPADESLEG